MYLPYLWPLLLSLAFVYSLPPTSSRQKSNTVEEKTKNFSFPKSFAECADFIVHAKFPNEYVQEVQRKCLDGFVSVDHTHDWAANFTTDEQNYINSIFRKVISDAAALDKIRNKREAELFPKGVRREVRAIPYQYWKDFARNVKRLKYDAITINGRSKYDIIADLHGTAVQSAHFGPNFLPWHRLYLIIFETALGVPIPYWESPIDFEMRDPTQSVLWSEKYFGNGFGLVTSGPFKNFQTPVGPLFRNIGSDGSLMERKGVAKILQQTRLAHISDPTAVEMASLEGQHNGVHIWIDGQMNNLMYSPHDPVFWVHHSFVDFVWDMFRSLQKKRGIDPTTDTVMPPEEVILQNFTDPAVGLNGYYNNDGYSKLIASKISFEPTPRCPLCANSQNLFCDKKKQVCVSKKRDPTEFIGKKEEAIKYAMSNKMINNETNSHPFRIYQRDSRVRRDSVTLNYNNLSNMGYGQQANADTHVQTRNGLIMQGTWQQANGPDVNSNWEQKKSFDIRVGPIVNVNEPYNPGSSLTINGNWQPVSNFGILSDVTTNINNGFGPVEYSISPSQVQNTNDNVIVINPGNAINHESFPNNAVFDGVRSIPIANNQWSNIYNPGSNPIFVGNTNTQSIWNPF